MNTLYIQIDNNSLPEEYDEDIEVLDCRCINDFCSIVGDVLVNDLKDENGKPYYRLINPVGRLLVDFKSVDDNNFNTIIDDWYDFFGNLLHKGKQEENLRIQLPQQYVDWLTHNESPYYERVGLELQKNEGMIELSLEDFVDDIIASLNYKIRLTLQDRKDDIAYVVFSNPLIRNSSFVAKNVKFDGIEFLRYDSWKEQTLRKKKDFLKMSIEKVSLTINGISFNMIRVKGGEFTMGATSEQANDFFDDEKPTHRVTLSSYYIGETEVTQSLWEAVMGSNPSQFHGVNRPVEMVSWNDCQIFLCKLNTLTGWSFRLPTEAEWEFAARGGSKSEKNHICKYSGNNDINTVAWYKDNSGKGTHPVKTKDKNELGIYDMSGNVWEWCQDLHGSYSSASQTDPVGTNFGTLRVSRGGCWNSNPRRCRVSFRGGNSPDLRENSIGLRLACSSYFRNEEDQCGLFNKLSAKDNAESTGLNISSNDDMDYHDNGWPIDGDWPWYNP